MTPMALTIIMEFISQANKGDTLALYYSVFINISYFKSLFNF